MKKEKISKPKMVFETRFCEQMDVDELMAIIKNAKTEHGAEYVELYDNETSYGCGDYEHESYELEFYKTVKETDEEYNKRNEREKIADEKRKREKEAQLLREKKLEEKKVEKEKETLKELMVKYPGIAKNRRKK